MSFKLIKIPSALLTMICLLTFAFAQNAKPPREEKLLNGMKILLAGDPSAEKISVKIRLHSGSAFDPQGREGVMKMLAENIFPTDVSRDYFADDLGGSLDVTTNYDYIQINATAKPANLLPMLETLARAVSTVTIDKDSTAKLKTARLEKLKELEKNQSYVADQIAAKKFFGSFPYGRPIFGTTESVVKIDFADLLLAKQRFLTADNATVAVSGNFNSDLAFRAIRRFFGVWEKSDKRVPSTFRQPDEPDAKVLTVNFPNAGTSEVRFLTGAPARGDLKFPASEILAQILQNRLQTVGSDSMQIRQEAHVLPGALILSGKFNSQPATENGGGLKNLLSKNITDEEFGKARTKILSDVSRRDLIDWRLDADTFRLNAAGEMQFYQNTTLAEVESLRVKFASQPVAAVVVTDSETKK